MRASEALMLGSLMIKPVRGMELTPDRQAGCAIGMITVATGWRACVQFPWLLVLLQLECPCCRMFADHMHAMIVHMFDMHVNVPWYGHSSIQADSPYLTIDEIAEYIEAHDPTPKPDDMDQVETVAEPGCEKSLTIG